MNAFDLLSGGRLAACIAWLSPCGSGVMQAALLGSASSGFSNFRASSCHQHFEKLKSQDCRTMHCICLRASQNALCLTSRASPPLRLALRRSTSDAAGSSALHGHVPVLLGEVLDAFSGVNLKVLLSYGIFAVHPRDVPLDSPCLQVHVDGTLGAGGHAYELLQHHPVRYVTLYPESVVRGEPCLPASLMCSL